MRHILRSFYLIINYKTFVVTALAVLSTYVCYHLGWTAKFPDMLVGVAIVFPVVFSIGSAYTRRETALQRLADLRGHAISLYFAVRDWPTDRDNNLPKRTKQIVNEMMALMRDSFRNRDLSKWPDQERRLYGMFSELSTITMQMRNFGVQSGEISRISQYVSKIIVAFDNLKIIHVYRTPITLRAYSKVFIYTFPIIYGPYFASTFNEFSAQLEYVMPVLYSFILVSLDNIQDHLEDPFDQIGEDDIIIDVEETAQLLV